MGKKWEFRNDEIIASNTSPQGRCSLLSNMRSGKGFAFHSQLAYTLANLFWNGLQHVLVYIDR